jgi:GNAT superfamily N-acetyltransferase
VFSIRAMQLEDVAASEQTWDGAYRAMRARYGLPPIARTPPTVASTERRLRHLLATDPLGSFVAIGGDEVVGMAQGFVRGELWVLSLFAVMPASQGRGIGRRLLDAAVDYGRGRRGMILCSRDPAAMRRYSGAGFALHPAFVAWGVPRIERLPSSAGVRAGGADDRGLVDDVDREVRGEPHGADLDCMLAEGAELLVHDDGGYAMVHERPRLVAARTDAIATSLLAAALQRAPSGATVDFGWITAEQQWAMRVALDAGLELVPHGPVGLRGFGRAPAPYLPSGAFG